MARRRGVPEYIWIQNTSELEDFIEENDLRENTKQFSQYHFRIATKKCKIEIWAGRKKYLATGKKVQTYNDPKELLPLLK